MKENKKDGNTIVSIFFYLDNNFLYKLSIHIAPNGAVISIDITATVRTNSPHTNPIDKGIVPIAACTVAFGVYACCNCIF